MEAWGHKVKWEDGQKYITYITPENQVCRDRKLFAQTLLRENMECYFAMGGSSWAWREFGEPEPTVDDVVCGLVSIFEALTAGDNDRFHMETIHHSRKEIRVFWNTAAKSTAQRSTPWMMRTRNTNS